jgi:hypothetical protein
MKAQRDLLFNSLSEHGWRVVEVQEFHNVSWVRDWVDELWIIESIWRPVGFRSFVFFLIDKEPSRGRRKGEGVLEVRVSKEFKEIDVPEFGEDYEDFPIGKGRWKQSINDLFAKLARFRQSGL